LCCKLPKCKIPPTYNNQTGYVPLGAGVGPGVGLGWPGSGVTYGTGVGALVTDPPVITPGLGVGMETPTPAPKGK
jgi:hypothetical protein